MNSTSGNPESPVALWAVDDFGTGSLGSTPVPGNPESLVALRVEGKIYISSLYIYLSLYVHT